ncbi:DNA repair exonuclease [Lactiplantibacillus sp. WILCCON 0030]|uniref:DNA repair exonuclease n=1 Tax=Lactiplantibacillus brownii TaxID=3069269 RepID=A0ABU1A8A6_9LACO|nr:DNA repair exonuclease [Lactiplantibacillus brownii]MDQ7937165.1 DNA repair exonuclease [Lactiplantibacillus brownii]
MKFIHAADLHLDTPFQGLTDLPTALQTQIMRAPIDSLNRLVDLAIDEAVDFVLLVGDLFDQAQQSVQAQAALMLALERLNDAEIPVILSFGNHDFQPDDADWHFPANVHAFGSQVETVTLTTAQQTKVAITGFSYAQRWLTTPMIDQFPMKTSSADYQIGMWHGQTGVAGDHYAPFKVSELLGKHYDYWALGHIHQRQELNAVPPIDYPGNLQGRQRNETGAKGCLLVSSTADHQLRPVFKPLATILWQDWTPTLSGEVSRSALLAQLTDQLNAAMTTPTQLVSITLPETCTLTTAANLALTQGTLLRQLQQATTGETWWPVDLQLAQTTSAPATLSFGEDGATWQAVGQQVISSAKVAEIADRLLDEDFLNRALLETLTPDQWQQQVRQLLTDHYQLTTQKDGSTNAD